MNLFSLFLGLGTSLGMLRVMQGSPAKEHILWLSTALVSLLGGLIGARIGFVINYLIYFKTNIPVIFKFWQGGLSWPGALAGTILFAGIAEFIIQKPFRVILDKLSVLLLPIATAVWLGCWQIGVAYGKLVESGTWWGILAKDESGLQALRVPVQLAAALSLFLLVGFTEWLLTRTQYPGLKTGILGLVFSLHALLFSFMRADPAQQLFGLRLDSWAAIFYVTGFTIFLLLLNLRKLRRISTAAIIAS